MVFPMGAVLEWLQMYFRKFSFKVYRGNFISTEGPSRNNAASVDNVVSVLHRYVLLAEATFQLLVVSSDKF